MREKPAQSANVSPLRADVFNEDGQTILGVLISAAIMAILGMAFISMFKSQNQAARNIAARGGVTDLSHALDALFGSPSCATIGQSNFVSGGVSPATITLIPGPPPTYSLSLETLQFANGSVAITSLADPVIATMIQPYSISGLTFTALSGNSATFYPFQMTVTFTHPNGGPPPLPLKKFVTVVTDTSNPPQVVGACYKRPRSSMIMQVFDTSGTFTVPADTSVIQVEVWGGGGGGSGWADGYAPGGGGGAYAMDILTVVPGTVYPVTVGLGGAGGAVGSAGGTGGTSSFGSLITAGGGTGGQNIPFVSPPAGTGGISTGGALNIPGQGGATGTEKGIAAANGAGGSSPRGGAGGPSSYGLGPAGSTPGGGGGGGGAAWATAGGRGGDGRVVVIMFE